MGKKRIGKEVPNNIAVLFPILKLEWHKTLNGDKRPEQYTKGSAEMIVWQCSVCGEVYSARINTRTKNKNHYIGCKVCRGGAVVLGENDVLSQHPYLKDEFIQEKNGEKTLAQYADTHSKRLLWRCPKCGYEYKELISVRIGRSRKTVCGCPRCSEKRPSRKVEFLCQTHPLIAQHIHQEDNPEFCICNLTKGSHTYITLRCSACQGKRTAQVHDLIRSFCPDCSNDKATPGVDDIATTHPHIAKIWASRMNLPHTPRRYKASSTQLAYFQCQYCKCIDLKPICEKVADPLCPKCHRFPEER